MYFRVEMSQELCKKHVQQQKLVLKAHIIYKYNALNGKKVVSLHRHTK